MSSRSLAWLALVPLLVACAADADTGGSDGANRPGVADKNDDPAATGDDGNAPGTTPAEPGATAPSGTCLAQPACNGTTAPQLAPTRSFNHYLASAIAASGPAFHRGRDQILAVGDPQWVIGKFTYSYIDTDMNGDEDVDVFVERGCAGTWEKLGSTKTTASGEHATVEGVDDSGGRVYFQIPKANELAPGRHRVRLVMAADQTSTDLLLDILPKGSPIVVSDIDGTLTSAETAEYPALLTGSLPDAQPRAAEALSALAAKGYHPVYLTARPEWLTSRTKEFLTKAGFPPGVVHTTTGITGALGAAASTFKTAELSQLQSHGHKIEWAFGNTSSDTDAYHAAKINPVDHRVFLRLADEHGGRRIEAYSEIVPALTALPSICR